MSFQRARTFCRQCHVYAQIAKIESLEKPDTYVSLRNFATLLRDNARNYAMQAVEKCPGDRRMSKALDACEACDYKNPIIAEMLE